MKATTIKFLFIGISILFLNNCSDKETPASNIRLSPIFSDNMVLQQQQAIPIWGKASPGGTVAIHFKGQIKKTIVSKDSSWIVQLDSCIAGGPFEMKIIGQDTNTLRNIMVGEVWVCSGQSNMEMPLYGWGKVNNYEEEIANANFPNIRLLTIDRIPSLKPLDNPETSGWKACSSESIEMFSATAYFFAKNLQKELKIPIGLIHSSWGGTPAEAWTPEESLLSFKEFKAAVESNKTPHTNKKRLWQDYYLKMDQWKQKIDSIHSKKIGLISWEKVSLDDNKWDTISLPSLWESSKLPDTDGLVWFRKSIMISKEFAAENLTLHLGEIDDQDVSYINGVIVGSNSAYNIPRVYPIPKDVIHSGDNSIAILVLDYGGKGGFNGSHNAMYIETDKGERINLGGSWKYRFLADSKNIGNLPEGPNSPSRPAVLFNAMINPIIPYGIQGVIWYQGESNASRAEQYRSLFPTMIKSWREEWKQGDFPFLFVQLANYMERKLQPAASNWAMLREAQSMALSLPNTGMTVAIDIGNEKDIHPKNKQDIGRRLALNALHIAYAQNIINSGPVFKSMLIEHGKIKIKFSYSESGLITNDGKSPKGFAIAGADKQYKWAKAKIEGNTILIWNESISDPVSLRYGWADNPECNLYNLAGLPAVPFRTDNFEN